MPASFAAELCGYRLDNSGNVTSRPNTSDASDPGSIELGAALFGELEIPKDRVGRADPGALLEAAIQADLQPARPDLTIQRSRSALEFQQYAHLRIFPEFKKGHVDAAPTIAELQKIAEQLPPSTATTKMLTSLKTAYTLFSAQDGISDRLKLYMPEESLLKLDLTCAVKGEGDDSLLRLGLSSKWTLRTDRAQDCVSQGSKLASQRRGPMPHYAVITFEPRPSMLKILADGSGSVDYVYHLDLPALIRAMDMLKSSKRPGWSPGVTFDRLMNQGRLRDYDDLVCAVASIPRFVPPVAEMGVVTESGGSGGSGSKSEVNPQLF